LKKDGYPVTDKVWDTSLSIPIYPSLDNREIERIIDGFIGEYSKYNGSANS
jgi:dTDP-4-amino-4,6-dideoxygalactose transaminase